MKISVIWEGNSKITVSVPDSGAEEIFDDLASRLLRESKRVAMRERINLKRSKMEMLEKKIENTVERREVNGSRCICKHS